MLLPLARLDELILSSLASQSSLEASVFELAYFWTSLSSFVTALVSGRHRRRHWLNHLSWSRARQTGLVSESLAGSANPNKQQAERTQTTIPQYSNPQLAGLSSSSSSWSRSATPSRQTSRRFDQFAVTVADSLEPAGDHVLLVWLWIEWLHHW